ncbi:hypothetical protein FJQ36_15130 [Escherichia coli]|nr:hypothetical protein [Escherichia coli]
MGATIFRWVVHETLFDLAGQWMKQQIKKRRAICPPVLICTLIFRLTIYIAKTLSNLTACFERRGT